MQNGENAQALRQILDFIRLGSIIVLLLHFYAACYEAVMEWHISVPLINRVVYSLSGNIRAMQGINNPKLVVLLLLTVSLIGTSGKKDEKQEVKPLVGYILVGLLFFFASYFLLFIHAGPTTLAGLYISVTSTGYVLLLTGGTKISRLLRLKYNKDIFNDLNESFPQEETLIANEYSVNLPTEYVFKGKTRKGWINLPNIFRGTIVAGTPGSGKSFWVVRNFITQLVDKQFCFFLYDFKFPDLTLILYNHALKNAHKYPVPPKFYIINFDDLAKTHRCNVLYPETMLDLTDATESARTLMLSLNRDWIKKSGGDRVIFN